MRDPREIELIRLLLPAGRLVELGKLLERTGIGSDELPVFMEGLRQSGFVFSPTEKTIHSSTELGTRLKSFPLPSTVIRCDGWLACRFEMLFPRIR